jgi:hypothetical protein
MLDADNVDALVGLLTGEVVSGMGYHMPSEVWHSNVDYIKSEFRRLLLDRIESQYIR